VRRVDRRRRRCPDLLDGPQSRGAQEERDAVAYAANPALDRRGKPKPFRHACYRDPDVRDAINELFHGKCAYCESRYLATQPVEVEHYRPKRLYPWLGADWSNLLASCIDCNRERYQHGASGRRKSGKHDHFPLVDDRMRSTERGTEHREQRLLLDPTVDDDVESVLQFGDGGVVNGTDQRSRETIRVLGLDREGLRRSRADHLIIVDTQIERVLRLTDRLATGAADPYVEEDLARELGELKRLLDEASQPFVAMTRQRVRDRLERPLGIELVDAPTAP
jgi:uncharacterized protein (TIGR02646 family)